ncbi:DUF6527 family protein [Hymenobacter aranciens]|uniref:DUF6527 family protein n=1 Tax=Hymenobacter aranciens TaxID=3063996 RepID=UPI00351073D2
MKRYLHRWWQRVSSLFGIHTRVYTYHHVRDFPEDWESYTVYLLGKPGREWLAGFSCPCGCKERIELVLSPAKHPCWRLEKRSGDKVTFSPSVWRSVGCRSHFFLRNGEIIWC